MGTHRFETLIEVLECQAKDIGQKPAFTFRGGAVTFNRLWQSINNFGSHLLEMGIQRGQRVVIALPNGEDFFTAFYGAQRAGGIPVPIFPGAGIERILSVAALTGAEIAVLSVERINSLASGIFHLASSKSLVFTTVSTAEALPASASFPEIYAEDIAFIQYTSGSTGEPKGVQLSHHNLLTNIEQMVCGMEISPKDTFVSWLPVYHDMGLILMTMTPFFLGAEAHLLPTNVRDFLAWLGKIQETKATFSAAPDFAYRLCSQRIERHEDINISSLRVALNAAEPVRSSTIREFENRFRLTNVMTAGYGLAEATVGVSMSPSGKPVQIDQRGFVSVGPPFPGVEVQIRTQDRIQPAGEIGEITIRSRANAAGYFNDPEATRRIFSEDGFLKSGDLGYLDGAGNLYITGREKSVIKRFGETISPQEIEEAVDLVPAVRFCAAIGLDRGGLEGEQIFIFSELKDEDERDPNEYFELNLQIVRAMQDRMGYRPGRVYLLRRNAIPRTYNGKIQHAALKERYLNGSLRNERWILYPDF